MYFLPTISDGFKGFLFLICITLHCLLYLVPQWSLSLCAKFWYRQSGLDEATHVFIEPTTNNGKSQIVEIHRGRVVFVMFQQKKFVLSGDSFKKLDYLQHVGLKMKELKKWRGLNDKEVKQKMEKYGKNKFDIPIPTFLELMKEHTMAPFFVFQVFCVGLWMLDDMWYFSLFTLFMLIVFESTVVFQRLKNLQEFRQMSIEPYNLYCYRSKWIEVKIDELLPGDLVSITRREEPIPCDLVLIDGSCICNEAMLSGESTPQLKECIKLREDSDVFKIKEDRMSVLFGGTKVLQVTASVDNKAPDDGCLAVVLRTGFATQQGKLVRTIVYATERVSANNLESLLYILFLLMFAIAAAYYVWTTGSEDEDRDHNKLLLHCIMIVTSVVPPELPMELSMAVNNSLAQLGSFFVYCTEPFRIPFAGKIDVACFDKTGTLTAENLIVEGIGGISKTGLVESNDWPDETKFCLAGAHSLVMLDGQVVGDPMEKNTLESMDWGLQAGDKVKPNNGSKTNLQILRRFAFSSQLKRMSSITLLNNGNVKKVLVCCKGAPETIKEMLTKVPKGYDEEYKQWARKGKRVLALGFKYLDTSLDKLSDLNDLHRDEVESGLTFCGFLIFYCPLKSDSIEAIQMLNESSHRVTLLIDCYDYWR